MQKVTVTEKALREMLREILENKEFGDVFVPEEPDPSPSNVSDVVDPSAALTDPTNSNFKPHSRAELSVAVKAMTNSLADDQVPQVYDMLKGAIDIAQEKEEGEMMKKQKGISDAKDLKVEEAVRRAVRRALQEVSPRETWSYSGPDFSGESKSDEEEEEERLNPKRKFNTATDVGGDSFQTIADELGFSVAGAKQAVDKALLKAQWVGKMQTENPEDLEIIVLTSMNDYINMLNKTGELSPADMQLMKDHPDIVRDLDGFRDFLDRAVRKARKPGDLEDPLATESAKKKSSGAVILSIKKGNAFTIKREAKAPALKKKVTSEAYHACSCGRPGSAVGGGKFQCPTCFGCAADAQRGPACEECGKNMTPRDKAAYEAEGGSGWPVVCEMCAEMS